MPRDDAGVAADAYGRAALDRECGAIRAAPFGSQESTINAACFNIGTLVGSGGLDEAEALAGLRAAALSVPSQAGREAWSPAELERKVRDAFRAGQRNPRGTRPQAGPPPGRQRELRVAAVYDYRDAAERLLFQVVRFEPKTFRQRRPDDAGGWVWSVRGVGLVPYRLPELLAAPPAEPVFVPEGEKDVDALRGLGLVATCNPMGAGKWREEFGRYLEGRDVVVLPDADEAGRPHGADVAAKLAGRAAQVRVLEMPPPHKDVSDWLAEGGGTAARLLEMAAEVPAAGELPAAGAEAPDDGRPVIRLAAGDIARVVDEAEAALIAAGLGFYQRGAFIVRPGAVRISVSDDRSVVGQRLVPAGEHALLEALTTAARWEKFDGRSKGYVRADPPPVAVKVFRDRVGRWRLPFLAGVVNAPTLRPDGSVLSAPGYDAATGLLYDPGGASFPAIPERPTRDAALRALATLKDLVGSFPFQGEADRAVALSAILTACVRRSLHTAPMHAFSAPAAGSGKSLLVDLASTIANGREAGVIAQGATEEETEKRLGALLLAGDAVIAIDNCEAPLGGEFLCQVLTQPVVKARILGRSEAPELPSGAFVTATGNNLTLVGDMTRRALLCRLDAGVERPELRRFERDPVAHAKAERGRYVAAALTVLRAHHVAGRPSRHDAVGSFGAWSRWVRDALVWLGEDDPAKTMEVARASDPKLATLRAVVEQWRQHLGDERVTTRRLIDSATETRTATAADGPPYGRPEFARPDFREALLAVAGAGGAVNGRSLGKWLAANQGRVVDGSRIVQQGTWQGTATWRLARS